jgi:hypothetical protein
MYTDPDGEFIWIPIVIGAFIGAMVNVAVNADNITSAGAFFAYAGIGALAGGLGGAAGFGAGAAIGVSGFIGGMATDAAAGATGGFITGAGNTWMPGGSFGPRLFNGFKNGANGVVDCATPTENGVYCYSYARNNPPRYPDPTGEIILIPMLIGAVVAAVSYTINTAMSPGGLQENWNWGLFAFHTMFGAVMEGMSAGIGKALTPALTAIGISGAAGGAITGAVTGTFTSTMNGFLQYSMTGNTNTIWRGALIGMGTGAAVGGFIGA